MNVAYTRLVMIGNRGVLTTDSFNANENYYSELKTLTKIKRVKNFSFIRVGKNNDGGYIMLDDFPKNGGGAEV